MQPFLPAISFFLDGRLVNALFVPRMAWSVNVPSALGKPCLNRVCGAFLELRVSEGNPTRCSFLRNCWALVCPNCGMRFDVREDELVTGNAHPEGPTP